MPTLGLDMILHSALERLLVIYPMTMDKGSNPSWHDTSYAFPPRLSLQFLHPYEDQGTWLSKGGWKRIDCVVLPLAWIDTAMVAAWTTVIEKDVATDDHKAVCVRVHLAVPVKQTTLCRSPHTSLRLNNAEMCTPHGKKQCQAILRQMIRDHPGYDAPADLQAAYISEAAHQSLKDSFPPQPRVQRPSWITDETWKVVGASRQLQRRLQQLRSTAQVGFLREVFQAWKQPGVRRPSCRLWLRQHDKETALALRALHRCRHQCTTGLRTDEAMFLQQCVCAKVRFAELNEAKGTELWKKLRYTLPKYRKRRRKPLPMHETHSTLLQHFASIEDAQIQDASALQLSSIEHSVSALGKAIRLQVASLELPSIFELEDAIRSLQTGTAAIGVLSAGFLKSDPAAAASLLFPSLLALFRFFQQPISWKGGQYFPRTCGQT